jgi:hypothetical protein
MVLGPEIITVPFVIGHARRLLSESCQEISQLVFQHSINAQAAPANADMTMGKHELPTGDLEPNSQSSVETSSARHGGGG